MIDKKTKLIIRSIIAVLLVGAITFSVLFFINLVREEKIYWITHFGACIILIFVSGIAFLLPVLNQTKYVGDGKGDSLMLIVGILLFLTALLSIGISYMNN